jgi:hypothetical protein
MLAKGGTSKKRPSPYLHKVPTRSNKASPRTFQTALVCVCVCVWILLFATVSRPAETHPVSFPIGTGNLSPEVMRPPSSAEVKNAWSFTSTPPYDFMAWYLIKHKGNFTFYFYNTYIFMTCFQNFLNTKSEPIQRDAWWNSTLTN